MGKIADSYFKVDPWAIVEEGFDPSHGRVSESVFSLGNEYMGVRGYFEEGYSGEKQIGSYFNGLYEETDIRHPAVYKGFVHFTRDLTNAVDWLYMRIRLDGELLDIAESKIEGFRRILDLRRGILVREFIWHTRQGKQLKITFERFLSMVVPHLGCQKVTFEPINFSGDVQITSGLDFTAHADYWPDSNWDVHKKESVGNIHAALGRTRKSGLYLFSSFRVDAAEMADSKPVEEDRFIGITFDLPLKQGRQTAFKKMSINYAGKKGMADPDAIWQHGMSLAESHVGTAYESAQENHVAYWKNVWENLDITIEGDPENQQGIRFCIFQLHQTYHGEDSSLNIGAKGLTGEAYGGKAFWDTEAYCLQFYLFNNPKAAKNLLEYRYNLLPLALERAKQLDCKGACYPISAIDGEESCGAWQHSSLQIHVSVSIAYGIWHYNQVCSDKEFLYREGIEMLIQICRFYASRAQQDPQTLEYGFYGVMGVDEFHMMVNNNFFLNFMVKKTMAFTLSVIEEMRATAESELANAFNKTQFNETELHEWRMMADRMNLPQDRATSIYEQHDGFFRLPHIDIHAIPMTDFPLYHNWSYDRIYRTDMIKQADVLMAIFLYSQDFSLDIKKANYVYYEPKCIHESSLSPSVHSILAAEIGKKDEAYEFFKFATRLDLDDYNRNTVEGLHTTSIAAAWMNIVYGFGGMRSDRDILTFNPTIPDAWQSYSFRILYKNSVLVVTVTKEKVAVKTLGHSTLDITLYGSHYQVSPSGEELIVSL